MYSAYMDNHDVKLFLIRLENAMQARTKAEAAEEMYTYRYDGCEEQRNYEKALTRLGGVLDYLISSHCSQSPDGDLF